jgi:hypothetical protein
MDWGHGSSGRALASKHKALSSNSSTIKEEKGKGKGQETPSFPPLPAGAWGQLSQVQGTPQEVTVSWWGVWAGGAGRHSHLSPAWKVL